LISTIQVVSQSQEVRATPLFTLSLLLDGIVLGKFNRYDEIIDPSYIASMDKQLQSVPGDIRSSTAITPVLSDVASVFDGSIVYVGMFSKYGLPDQKRSLNFTQTVRGTRDNLSIIDGRK